MSTNADRTDVLDLLARATEALASQQNEPPEQPQSSSSERVLLTIEQAAEQLGIGRTLMYRLIRSGEVNSVRIGRLRRVPASAIHDYAEHLMNQQGPTDHVA